MKRVLHLAGLVLALVIVAAPAAEALTGTVYNGFMNCCDVNRDGAVTATDVTVVYNYLLGAEDVSAYDCDVNLDGSVTTVDITIIYNVILDGGFYNSIFDAFNLNVANYFDREYLKFTWDDVSTLGYDVTNPEYMLVIGTDDTFHTYVYFDVSATVTTVSYERLTELLQTELGWTSPSDVPTSINLVARVEVKLDNDKDVIISNEKSFLFVPQSPSDPSSMIWQAGNANNWGNPSAGLALSNDGTYTGFMFLNGDFKFKQYADSWDGENWGAESYQTGNMSGNLVASGYNLYAPQGFYKVDVDLNNLYYNLTPISSVNIIGSAVPTGSQWVTDVDLTYNHSTGAWETYMVLNQGEFKFRANHEWSLNWGGTLDNLVPDGANLQVASPGAYHVQLFLTFNGNSHAILTRV